MIDLHGEIIERSFFSVKSCLIDAWVERYIIERTC
jgi:hypothetical protein